MPRPSLQSVAGSPGAATASHHELGEWRLLADASARLLFCENETNNQRLFGAPNASPYAKDGINDHVVGGADEAVNPEGSGTKLAAHHVLQIAPGESASVRLRLTAAGASVEGADPLAADFDRVLAARREEADRFYATVVPPRCVPTRRW